MEREESQKNVHIMDVFPKFKYGIDDVDIPPSKQKVSNLTLFFLISSIFMHLIDTVIDINLAVRYYLASKMTYFVWTAFFIFVPSFINVIVSRRMQQQDEEVQDSLGQKQKDNSRRKFWMKIGFFVAGILQLAPVIHYYTTLRYALKSRKRDKIGDTAGRKHYFIKMLKEDQDVALLRVFECFIEAAPQQILQLSILLQDYHNSINFEFIHQVINIVSSLGSMGWAMASYNCSIRLAQQDKPNISCAGGLTQFIWHFCITVSRILSISIIASVWPLYTAIFCTCHWFGMIFWILYESHGMLQFCRNHRRAAHMSATIKEHICSILFSSIIGLVHTFIYLNPLDGRTFYRHTIFYSICFLENVIAAVTWGLTCSEEAKNAWYFESIIALCIIPFIIGVVSLILYYTVFHPSTKIKRAQNIDNTIEISS